MKKNKKIFIVTEFFSANQNSTGYFWEKIIKKFASENWTVNLIAPDYGDVEFSRYPKSVIFDIFKLKKTIKNNIISKISLQFFSSFSLAKIIFLKKNNDELFLSGTNPAAFLIFMPFLKRVKKAKWVLLMHDLYPDNLLAAGYFKENNLIYKLINSYYSFVYNSADGICVIGRDMQKKMEEKVKDKDKIFLVQNWVSADDVYRIDKKESFIIKYLGWENKKVFQFFGNFGKLQDLGNIINAIELIDKDDICFLFIGGGSEEKLVQDLIARNKRKNIFFYGKLCSSMRSEGLSACDFSIVSLADGMLGLGVPSKAYFTMAADRKILGILDKDSEIALTILENNIGVVVPPGDSKSLAAKIVELSNCSEFDKFSSPRDVFLQKFNEDDLLNKFFLNINRFV